MRRLASLVLGLGLLAAGAPAQAAIGTLPAPPAAPARPFVKIGYWCSPGFEASYGRCVATASTDQVDLYLNEPGGYARDEAAPPPRVFHKRRRHALHDRY